MAKQITIIRPVQINQSFSLHSCFKAEIRRLQEANKAARKESQLLLKQQEEIERMRNSTIKLRERLKIAGGNPPPVSSTLIDEFIDGLIYRGSFHFIVCIYFTK